MYIEYVYNLSLSLDENAYQNKTEEVLKELVSQRLAQVAQFLFLGFIVPGIPADCVAN